MSIESEIERLQIAKSNLKTAIMGKGVHVDDTDKLDTYYMLVSQIEEDSGGGIDVSATTVTAGDVLAGKKFYDSNGVLTEGTIEEATISGEDDKFGFSITSGYLPEPFEYYAANGTYEITQNTVVLKSGYFMAQTINVGTRFTETSITPGTADQVIPADSYIYSDVTIPGEPAYLSENIRKGASLWGLEGSYEGEGGIDTSDATVTSEDLTAGAVAYGKDGKVYGSRIYAEDPMVYFHNGQLKADQPVYLDPGNPVTMYTFDGTASPDDVVEGESVYVAGGKVTGSMSHLTVGGMVIQENAMLSIPSKSYVEFENYQLRDIAGIGDLAAENIAKGKTICGIEGTYEGESSGGSFDIVKVTEYSPYIPAYPEQIGYVIAINATMHSPETDSQEDYDLSAYEGLYTVTEETKTCKSFGRTFKNANGKYLYAWTYDTWSQATDETSSAQWCISDDPSSSPDYGVIAAANSCNNGVLPDDASGWQAPMGPHQITLCTLTAQVTAPATAAIPMVLKGSVTSGYNTETKVWTDGTASSNYNGFEIEPYKYWYYASTSGNLIGGAVDSKVPPSLYIPFHESKATAETGQTITSMYNDESFKTIEGVRCVDTARFNISPVDFLVTGKDPFALSVFLCPIEGGSIFEAYNTGWPPTERFQFALDGMCIRIRGGNLKNAGSYDPLISSYMFQREKWVHVVYTHYASYEEVYINGEKIWRNQIKREFVTPALNYARIGMAIDSGGYWSGYLSEFKYFSDAISPAQIKNEADRCLAMVGSGDSSGNVNWGDDDLNDTGS